jgi:hypothetical protein
MAAIVVAVRRSSCTHNALKVKHHSVLGIYQLLMFSFDVLCSECRLHQSRIKGLGEREAKLYVASDILARSSALIDDDVRRAYRAKECMHLLYCYLILDPEVNSCSADLLDALWDRGSIFWIALMVVVTLPQVKSSAIAL